MSSCSIYLVTYSVWDGLVKVIFKLNAIPVGSSAAVWMTEADIIISCVTLLLQQPCFWVLTLSLCHFCIYLLKSPNWVSAHLESSAFTFSAFETQIHVAMEPCTDAPWPVPLFGKSFFTSKSSPQASDLGWSNSFQIAWVTATSGLALVLGV